MNRETAISYLNGLDQVYVLDGFANWDPEVCYCSCWAGLQQQQEEALMDTAVLQTQSSRCSSMPAASPRQCLRCGHLQQRRSCDHPWYHLVALLVVYVWTAWSM
jgi:hypothetical protein